MAGIKMTVRNLVHTVKEMEKDIAEYEQSLKKLRGDTKDWEKHIEEDKRRPVHLLYKQLVECWQVLASLCDDEVIVYTTTDLTGLPGGDQ